MRDYKIELGVYGKLLEIRFDSWASWEAYEEDIDVTLELNQEEIEFIEEEIWDTPEMEAERLRMKQQDNNEPYINAQDENI